MGREDGEAHSSSRRRPFWPSSSSAAHAASWAQIISLPLAVFASVLAYLAYKATWDVADLSGALDKPALTLGFGANRVPAESPIRIAFGTTRLGDQKTVSIVSMPFGLANEGKKSIDSATLTFRFPVALNRKGLDSMRSTAEGPTLAIQVQQSLMRGPAFDYSSYQAKSLDPGVGMTVHEPLHLTETRAEDAVPFITKDGVPLQAKITVHYALTFLITINGRDVPTVNHSVSMMGMRAQSLKDLASKAHALIVPKEQKEFRSKLSFLEYLGGLIFRSEKRRLYVAFQASEEHKVEDGTLLGPSGSAEVGYVTYELLSWAHLFK